MEVPMILDIERSARKSRVMTARTDSGKGDCESQMSSERLSRCSVRYLVEKREVESERYH
jgi:hypothetical protein